METHLHRGRNKCPIEEIGCNGDFFVLQPLERGVEDRMHRALMGSIHFVYISRINT